MHACMHPYTYVRTQTGTHMKMTKTNSDNPTELLVFTGSNRSN